MGQSLACNFSETCVTQDTTGAHGCICCCMKADSTKPDTNSDYEHAQEIVAVINARGRHTHY